MTKTNKPLALLLVFVVFASVAIPMATYPKPMTEVTSANSLHTTSSSILNVVNESINDDNEFDDDDFTFTIFNVSLPISQANVTLYNSTDLAFYDSHLTVGDGTTTFLDVPMGTYTWNVTLETAIGDHDPDVFEVGNMTSDGPEATVNFIQGNLDWDNDEDDFNATVTDIDGDPATALNFSIHHQENSSVLSQVILGADGRADFSDIPDGNYTWKVTIASGPYADLVMEEENFTTDGTQILVHQNVGPISGDPDYFDLEVFIYYETSIDPISNVLVNVTYKNGTMIESQTTTLNGTVRFLDLPVEFINWTVTLAGKYLGLGNYSYNLTTISTDIRAPIITSPGDQEFIFESPNITITWQIEDQYPADIELLVDGIINTTIPWTNETEYTFNATGREIGIYELTLVVEDLNHNTAEDTISLRIHENVTPTIEGPEDIEFYFTETGNSLRWNASDDYLNKYVIYKNDEEIRSGDIDPDFPFVSISVDGNSIGVYTYSFKVNDTSGNFAMDNVTVTVLRDDIAPLITYTPPTIFYAQGDEDIIRNWTATDDYKSNYTIEVDGFLIVSASWDSNTIEFDFAGLIAGTHNVVLTVTDLGGNTAESTVIVYVSEPTLIRYMLYVGIAAAAIIGFLVAVWYFRYR
ncbi:MAG: hypothetical protein ACXADL_01585 [Candidatus Thorarchaeota archaeon]|jgi:hypothetical protein